MRLWHAHGFTLIEVLVALLVLAVGVAGAAAAQVAATRTRHDSSRMSRAVQLAAGLAERMRANSAAMDAGDAANPYARFQYQAAGDGPPAPAPSCDGRCDSAQMAQADLGEVRTALHAGFPGGRALVCRDARVWDAARNAFTWDCASTPDAPLVIKVGWRMRRADGGAIDDAPAVAMVVGGVAP